MFFIALLRKENHFDTTFVEIGEIMNKFYGKYVCIGAPYDRIWIWRYDPNSSVTPDEQYRLNKRHVRGFRNIRLTEPEMDLTHGVAA
jgi:hypothetical protein